MKAKDYFTRFDGIPELTKETFKEILSITGKVVQGMIIEIPQISQVRKAKTDAAIFSIYMEMESKFQALTSMLYKKYKEPFIDNFFFSQIVHAISPEFWDAIHKVKRNRLDALRVK